MSEIVISKIPTKECEFVYLGNDVKVTLDKNIVEICNTYAINKQKDNRYYVYNRNADPKRLIKQDAYSKACEFAANIFLEKLGFNNLIVDTKIYKFGTKNWNADLGSNIAVKSTSSNVSHYILNGTNGKSRESWTFQYFNNNGYGGRDKNVFDVPLADQHKKYIIFATIENETIDEFTNVFIRGVVGLNRLMEYNMFKDPISDKLKGLKKNVYDNDLKILQQELKLNKLGIQTSNPK